MKLTTTLARIRAESPCREGWRKLNEAMPDMPPEQEFNILRVLDSNGVQDMLWCLRATVQDGKPASVALACAFALDVLPVFESVMPGDNRPRKAIEAAQAWVANPSQDAADAAYAADTAYAAADAYTAAYTAAYGARAAAYAARAAAYVAAYAARAAADAYAADAYAARAAADADAARAAADAAAYGARAAACAARQIELIKEILC